MRCGIDETFGHSLGPGVLSVCTRKQATQSMRGAPGPVLPVTRAIARGDPGNSGQVTLFPMSKDSLVTALLLFDGGRAVPNKRSVTDEHLPRKRPLRTKTIK